MKIIVVSRASDDSRTFELGRWSLALLSLCCLGLPLGMLAAGYMAGQGVRLKHQFLVGRGIRVPT